MSLTKIIFYILMLYCSFETVDAQDTWVLYTNEIDGSFSVEVPAVMDFRSKEVKTAVGSLETLAFTYEGSEEDKNKLYLINQVDYPLETFPKDSISLINEFLDSFIESAAESIGGKVVYKSEVERLGEGAYIFRIKYNEGSGVVKGKAILYNDTFYMLQVYSHVDDSLNEEMNYFLGSFKLK